MQNNGLPKKKISFFISIHIYIKEKIKIFSQAIKTKWQTERTGLKLAAFDTNRCFCAWFAPPSDPAYPAFCHQSDLEHRTLTSIYTGIKNINLFYSVRSYVHLQDTEGG